MFGAAVTPAGAVEKTITAQASAADGAFLPWTTAPAQPAGLCLVDTGVYMNPDTQSTVVDRTAIDGGSGDDVSPTSHGTVLAMMAGAPANGWGSVGIAPISIRIVSVRILEPEQTTFPFSAYASGITACLRVRQQYDVRVINLSLGDTGQPSSGDYEAVGNTIREASDYGVAIVAAAGNDDGGPVEYPAAYPGVLSVGASDTQSGAFCSFSNRGSDLRLIAPGCDLDGADPTTGIADFNYWQGTSEASAITAAALTALDSYRPDLAPQTAEQYMTDADHGMLDIAQAFRAAGLQQTITSGETAEPQPTANAPAATPSGGPASLDTQPSSVRGSASMTLTLPFPAPHARLGRFGARTLLVLVDRPREALAEVRYLGRRHDSLGVSVLRTLTGAFTRLTVPSTARTVQVRYIDPYDVKRASRWRTLTVPLATTRSGKSR